MKKLFIILFLAAGCTGVDVKPQSRARVITIGEDKAGNCTYGLEAVVPFRAPDQETIVAPCGRYSVGDIIIL